MITLNKSWKMLKVQNTQTVLQHCMSMIKGLFSRTISGFFWILVHCCTDYSWLKTTLFLLLRTLSWSQILLRENDFYFEMMRSPDALCACVRVRALSGAPQMRSWDEVRVAAPFVRFPCFDWSFKPTFWPPTKRKPSANKPALVASFRSDVSDEKVTEDSSCLSRFVRFLLQG